MEAEQGARVSDPQGLVDEQDRISTVLEHHNGHTYIFEYTRK